MVAAICDLDTDICGKLILPINVIHGDIGCKLIPFMHAEGSDLIRSAEILTLAGCVDSCCPVGCADVNVGCTAIGCTCVACSLTATVMFSM